MADKGTTLTPIFQFAKNNGLDEKEFFDFVKSKTGVDITPEHRETQGFLEKMFDEYADKKFKERPKRDIFTDKDKEYLEDDDKLDHEVVNDFSIDAIKDNFTPPGAKSKKKRMIRSKDKPEDIWDNEDTFKRFAITPYIKMQDDKDREQFWKEQKARSIDDLMNDKDYKDWYEFVGDEEDVKPNNVSWKSEYGESEGNPYADIDELIDKWDTNDNGEIEVDEIEKLKDDDDLEVENLKEKYTNSKPAREENVPGENYKRYPSLIKKKADDEFDEYLKDLDKYLSKNPKGREDIPATYKR